ncbi:lipocalin-like [Eublepharis macularius]|uniref:Lipocalin-like n=1 Tax=Eublepharis macularius TaxID=481883 RepID=A0AA97KBN2_EUBMA|nr:lipocalin-like [Eublepharis macularius]
MKCLMFSAALAIVYWLDFGVGVPVKPDFDLQQFAGKWYAIAIVKTRGPPESILVLDHIVEPLPNGDMLMQAQIPSKDKCKEENIHLSHTDRAGIFTTEKERVLSVVEASYESYYILSIETPKNGVLQLFARKPDVPTMVENMYLSRAQSLGFKIKFIINFNTMDRCP